MHMAINMSAVDYVAESTKRVLAARFTSVWVQIVVLNAYRYESHPKHKACGPLPPPAATWPETIRNGP